VLGIAGVEGGLEAEASRNIRPAMAPVAPIGNKNASKTKERKNKVANSHLVSGPTSSHSSDSRVRLTARIKRDRPDIGEKLDAGKFTSVRAAAREAGIELKGTF